MIKAILFDVDGVLLNEEKKYFIVFLEEEYGISQEITRKFFEGEWFDCVTGKKDVKEVLPRYLSEWGWQGTIDELLRYWHTKEHILNDPLLAEMDGYKKKGLKIYVATNQDKYRTEYIINDMGFGKIFDEVFASSHLGHQKPAKEYFYKILDQLVVFQPGDLLFWDDREENIESAKEVGLHAEQYQNFGHFKQVMRDKYKL